MFRILLALCCATWMLGCVPEKPQKKAEKAPSEQGMGERKMDNPMGDHPDNPHAQSGAGLDVNSLMAELPQGWSKVQPSSNMRLAQAAIARESGDNADGELAVFHFPGTGGSAMANLERWQGQMKGPHGEPGASVAKTDTMKLDNGVLVITTDIAGTLLASTMGTGPSSEQAEYRMIASVLETPAGNFFLKLTGPKKTIGANENKYRALIKRARLGNDA